MNEERYLQEKFGRQAPFTVPEGYFDDFATRIMDKLPQQQVQQQRTAVKKSPYRTIMRVLRPIAVAACLCGVVGGAVIYIARSTATESQAIDMSQYFTQDYQMEQMADYAMLSKEDFYLYMTEE